MFHLQRPATILASIRVCMRKCPWGITTGELNNTHYLLFETESPYICLAVQELSMYINWQ